MHAMLRPIIQSEPSHGPWPTVLPVALLFVLLSPFAELRVEEPAPGSTEKTENFDSDPLWPGVNNRIARQVEPETIRQDFGYSNSANTGGRRGELGGFISPAGEPAWYARILEPTTLDAPLRASGTLSAPDGSFHVLVGFFNAGTTKEWRTPNTIALRLNGRGDHFFAYTAGSVVSSCSFSQSIIFLAYRYFEYMRPRLPEMLLTNLSNLS